MTVTKIAAILLVAALSACGSHRASAASREPRETEIVITRVKKSTP